MKAAINSDEQETNARIDRLQRMRVEFGRWWREWAPLRACDTTHMREIAWEAYKAGKNSVASEQQK
jgi:hypothetical protein